MLQLTLIYYKELEKLKKYRAIIYDIDGTILNTLDMNMYPLLKIIMEETGEQWNFEDVLKFSSYPGIKVLEELEIKNTHDVYKRWVKYVNEFEGDASIYEGFPFIFEQFKRRNVIQAVVSSKTKEQFELDFVSKGLDKYMSTSILADDTDKHKPNPAPLLECISRLQVNSYEVIYIGDALSDYQACRNANIDFGYAQWGSVSDEGILLPTYVFEEPSDLLKLLEV